MNGVWRFLFASDYQPWPIQVTWKAVTWTLAGILGYVASTFSNPYGITAMSAYAAAFFFFGLFTKLGNP